MQSQTMCRAIWLFRRINDRRIGKNKADLQALLGKVMEMEQEVVGAAEAFSESLNGGVKILACGNGGSAADQSWRPNPF